MKIFTFLAACLLSFNIALGQIILTEDFSGTAWPPSGWTIDAQAGNWSRVATANAGGTAPEVRLAWSPVFNATTRFISPSLDLSSNTQGTAILSFRHGVDHYSNNFVVGVTMRKDNGTWTTIWSETVTANIPAQMKSIDIPAAFNTGSNVQFAFFFQGNTNDLNFWYLDDAMVLIPHDEDLSLTTVNIPRYFSDPVTVTGSVANMGMAAVTSFDLNWQIAGGDVNTTSISGINLALGSSYNFTADQLVTSEPGVYDIEVFINNVNGTLTDDDPANDAITNTISIAHESVSHMPLFEEFTSSTCPPCATFNNSFFNNFSSQNAENMVLIKYQMNWPGSGDPYYTPEGGVRRIYYGVSGVPSMAIDGKGVATTSAGVTTAYQQALSKPAFLDIEGLYRVEENNIILQGELMPYADFWDVSLHVVVIESVTYGNVGSNGETSFHHVMMKMLPDAYGTAPSLSANVAHPIEYTHNMSATNVEEMEDLMVVVFLQDNTTKEVFQSTYLTKAPMNPVQETSVDQDPLNVDPYADIIIEFNQVVTLADGSELTNENLPAIIAFNKMSEKNVPVEFTATINETKDIVTISPADNLDFEATYNIVMGPLVGAWDVESTLDLEFTVRASAGEPEVALNIENQATDIPVDQTIIATFNQAVKNEQGTILDETNVHELVTLTKDDETGEVVAVNVSINSEKTVITIEPANDLDNLQEYFLKIDAVMGVDQDISQEAIFTFTTVSAVSVNTPEAIQTLVYPVPARSSLNAEIPAFTGIASVRLMDNNGNVVIEKKTTDNLISLDVAALSSGQYYLEIVTSTGRSVTQVQIIK